MKLSLQDHFSERGIAKWIEALGVVDAPVPQQGVREALRYLSMHMMHLPPEMALNFLRATDLSKPVRSVLLTVGETLVAYRTQSESPYKTFFTRAGRVATSGGINDAGRGLVRFRVRAPIWVLESVAAAAIDTWTPRAPGQPLALAPRANSTGYMAHGGALQLLVPRSFSSLLVAER
jgi:hypothetical protein